MSITKYFLRLILVTVCFIAVGCGFFTKATPINDFAAECFGNSNDKAKIISSIEAANKKYKDKEIVLTGKILRRGVSYFHEPYVRFLQDESVPNYKKYISAKFKNPLRDYRNLKEGDNIKVRCKYYQGKPDYDFRLEDLNLKLEKHRKIIESYKNSYSIILVIEEIL